MYSGRSESGHRWQNSERSSRQWDDPSKRREKWPESHWDSHYKYLRDEHSSSERTSRNVEAGDSPQRRYSRDSLGRDWGRGSPMRRRVSSPVWDGYETKRRRYTEDHADHEYRQRHESLEKPRRLSPDSFPNNQKGLDFKYTASHDDDDFRYRRSPPDSWHRHPQDAYRKKSDDLSNRSFPVSYKDRDDQKRRQNSSQERRWSPDRSTKIHFKDKEHKGSSPTAECRQHRAGFSMNRSSGQAQTTDDATKSNEQKSSTGFQRFLEVLNQGVNVDDLTKIVTQISDQRASPKTLGNTVDRAGKHQNREKRGWGERSHTIASAKPQPRSLSPDRSPVEKSLPRTDGRDGSSRNTSKPSVVEKVLTPEEEQKQRQMQGVLQAIGLDLGFEELGQMSSRIQERLYGKKDVEDVGQGVSNERSTRQAFASKRRSRSWSSSRSSFSPLTRSSDTKRDLSSQRDEAEQHPLLQTADFGEFRYEDSRSNCHSSPAAPNAASPNSSYAATQPPPASPIPTYPPKNWSEFLYLPPSQAPPPVPPPSLAPVRPALFLPPFSGTPPGLPVVPPSIFPPALNQVGHFFPPPMNLPPFPAPAVNTFQVLNKTSNMKAKPQARPRCLQVIK